MSQARHKSPPWARLFLPCSPCNVLFLFEGAELCITAFDEANVSPKGGLVRSRKVRSKSRDAHLCFCYRTNDCPFLWRNVFNRFVHIYIQSFVKTLLSEETLKLQESLKKYLKDSLQSRVYKNNLQCLIFCLPLFKPLLHWKFPVALCS